MKNKIFCVRIAQRVIIPAKPEGYNHFPFDRVYLGKMHLAPEFKKLFRYYLSMPLDENLLDGLNKLAFSHKLETPVRRDDSKTEGNALNHQRGMFTKHITTPHHWLMVVPTHVITKYKKVDDKEKPVPDTSELGYILSKAIRRGYNSQVKMPQITLHTPSRKIPIMCAVCRNILEMHAGDCLPGRPTCKESASISLKLDTHNTEVANRSIEESGGDA
jgi:hypothetical protein